MNSSNFKNKTGSLFDPNDHFHSSNGSTKTSSFTHFLKYFGHFNQAKPLQKAADSLPILFFVTNCEWHSKFVNSSCAFTLLFLNNNHNNNNSNNKNKNNKNNKNHNHIHKNEKNGIGLK